MTLMTRSRLATAAGFVAFGAVGRAALLLLLAAALAACVPSESPLPGSQDVSPVATGVGSDSPDTALPAEAIPPRAARDCPGLDSQLFQLTQADDPAQMIEQLGLRTKEGKVQVLLLLASEETSFLQDFGAEVGTQVGNEVQAFMPIDQLCPLANHDAVLAVRPAAQAFP